MRRFARTEAQALVEFTLAATLLFFLLAAAVDLGLLFFTKQGITNAAQEGATFGSRWLKSDGATSSLDIAEIQNRVRFESGANGGNGITRLTDLNSDGVDDAGQPGIIDPTGASGFIQVRAVADNNMDGNPVNDGPAACANPAASTVSCYALVTVRKIHRMFFPLSPALGKEVTVSSTYYVLLRNTYRTNPSNTPPVFEQPTPIPDPDSLVVAFVVPSSTSFPNNTNGTAFEVSAYDKNVGTTNGAGIARVEMRLYGPGGAVVADQAGDLGVKYCLFGGNCNKMSSSLWSGLQKGEYTFQATAYAKDGRSKTVVMKMTK